MFEQLAATLKKTRRTIVFTEGEDARILDAARAVSPSNRPTTIRSAALKASCSTPESITGTAKEISLGRSLPSLKSISWARFTAKPRTECF